jgi:hypothetical protein
MQSIPIDTSPTRFGALIGLGVEPDTDPNTMTQRTREGVPAWRVQCLHRPVVGASGIVPKPGVEVVKVYATTAPTITEMAPCTFIGLAARFWEMGGRSGVSLSADSVVTAPAAAPFAGSSKAAA